MSKKDVVQLFRNEKIKEELRAVTNDDEIVKVGCKNNLIFTKEELNLVKVAASNFYDENKKYNINTGKNNANLSLNCYEYLLPDIHKLKILQNDLEVIKVKPNIADLKFFNEAFRIDDSNFASISPNSKEFQAQYDNIMKQSNNNVVKDLSEFGYFDRRDFHLINLDRYVNDKLYENYFQSKLRIVRTLTSFFGANVKLKGSFCYPPNAYRTWHTNDNAPGWRMYLIDFDQPKLARNGKSFFRYMHPETKKLVTLVDKPKLVRFFKIEQEQEKLFWHCIVNRTKAFRWSFGFHVPDNWMEKIKPHTVKSCG